MDEEKDHVKQTNHNLFSIIERDLREIRSLSEKNAQQLDEIRSKSIPAIHQIISGDENWKRMIEERLDEQKKLILELKDFKEKMSEKVFMMLGGYTVLISIVFVVLNFVMKK